MGQNFQFSRELKELKANGRVVIGFVVTTDGTLTDFIIKSDNIGSDAAEQVIKTIKSSEKNWIPGRQHGIPARASFTLPITLRAN